MTSRVDDIWAYLKDKVEARAATDALLAEQAFEEHRAEIEVSVCAALSSCLEQAEEKISLEEKGNIEFIVFSFLEASFLSGTYEIQIDLYDADFYLDLTECSGWFDYAYLSLIFDDSIQSFVEQAKEEFVRFMPYEVSGIRTKYREYLKKWVKEDLLKILCSESILEIISNDVIVDGTVIFYGQFLGNQEMLYQISGVE